MIRRRICLLAPLLLLAACAAPLMPPSQPIPLRNPTAQIASQADVTAQRLAGDWVVVQGAGIAPGTAITGTGQGLQVGAQTLTLTGPGRLSSGTDQLWVHWLDVSNRTAALGDPNGSRVWIMDRSAAASPDRITAAREILEWYGYDLTQLTGR